jgi:toxin ParE1/3/4
VVIWSEPAKVDLRHIFEYIAHDSHHYAKKVMQKVVDKASVLNDLPPHRPGGARSR